ncbi:D-alanine--D-alanine ligase [[Actinomadura] parvosata subsp. kistnae]|uniref:D-alanine--D-alanine ligase n=1 Tax=[Actinomadura] parvosata subsp. kistnae TaxID=1909395 RepID=A0A1V0AH57_9ACTN|nr:D-alanine--D-alanine ligase family protein [Nonomuraea sp. ATCC 55076]AQZ69509.1 D-alanine--D-alanine ligase [Nonomuraea sp. ATCC 55076]SPL91825.1 D-alanine--D-alanine ligase [Actinomadura parvosata subsp. kistnae]
MTERLRVAVLAGGPSAEHEVSLQSAQAVLDALPRDRYEPFPVIIDRQGRWPVELRRDLADVVFPVLHGPFGEDGVVQGHLQTLGLPYVGCGVLASAVAMDKVAMRRTFLAEDLPVTPYVWFTEHDWRTTTDPWALVKPLDWPMYVKPANMGSSIGISRVTSMDELRAGVDLALAHDRVVVVEQGVSARELICGVLGDHDTPRASVPGELIVSGEWLDYEAKYLSRAEIATIPAVLPERVADEVRELSLRAFRAINGYGLARVDFFYEEDSGRLYIGEINTMPGFTARSVYARAWAASGVPYPDLLRRLIDLALARSAA